MFICMYLFFHLQLAHTHSIFLVLILGTEGKEELKKIRAQVDADTTVLLEVKDQCTNIDVDMKLRTEARDAEIDYGFGILYLSRSTYVESLYNE